MAYRYARIAIRGSENRIYYFFKFISDTEDFFDFKIILWSYIMR